MNMLVTVALALIASAGFWATMQLIITRKGRTAEIARQQAETEKLKQDVATGEVARRKLLAEVESTALAAADARYDKLAAQSGHQRAIIVTLVDIMDTLVFRMRAAPDSNDQINLAVSSHEYLAARSALNEARTHLR